jgi:hypothetical protein
VIDPVKLCCGQRHGGSVRCPDGLVMCELCFERVTDDALMRDFDDPSKRWNICKPCGHRENFAVMTKAMIASFRPPHFAAKGAR